MWAQAGLGLAGIQAGVVGRTVQVHHVARIARAQHRRAQRPGPAVQRVQVPVGVARAQAGSVMRARAALRAAGCPGGDGDQQRRVAALEIIDVARGGGGGCVGLRESLAQRVHVVGEPDGAALVGLAHEVAQRAAGGQRRRDVADDGALHPVVGELLQHVAGDARFQPEEVRRQAADGQHDPVHVLTPGQAQNVGDVLLAGEQGPLSARRMRRWPATSRKVCCGCP